MFSVVPNIWKVWFGGGSTNNFMDNKLKYVRVWNPLPFMLISQYDYVLPYGVSPAPIPLVRPTTVVNSTFFPDLLSCSDCGINLFLDTMYEIKKDLWPH